MEQNFPRVLHKGARHEHIEFSFEELVSESHACPASSALYRTSHGTEVKSKAGSSDKGQSGAAAATLIVRLTVALIHTNESIHYSEL